MELLQVHELLRAEELARHKCRMYAQYAQDPQIKQLLHQSEQQHQQHMQTLISQLQSLA
ncbi:MAG: spore coat protein [Firmicutes bacterium]|nr:spore coat protein [Bacillota bacterium]